MQSELLYHLGKQSAVYQWRVWTEGPTIFTEYGQVGGQLIVTPGKLAEAKNVGRSNATTPEQQADIEAQAMFVFKLERKYRRTIEEAKIPRVEPMLAKTFGDMKKGVTYPADVQPKLDGCRCLAYWKDGRIVLQTRGGKEWNKLDHIVEQLKLILPEDGCFDGELYVHGFTFQQITKLVKSKFESERLKVQLHVYDMPICDGEEKLWVDRRADLNRTFDGVKSAHVVKVTTVEVASEEELLACKAKFLEFGFEGLMFRVLNGPYEWGGRSKYLLKLKDFEDTEFRIAGFTDGGGKNVGICKWICVLNDGTDRTFDCATTGTEAERKQLFVEGPDHVGKLVKVQHFGYTDDGKPRFPIALGVRDEADL